MAEAATTNAEFWWNHLTGKQQRFIVDQFKAEVDLRCIDVPEEAFKISAKWSKMTGWPA